MIRDSVVLMVLRAGAARRMVPGAGRPAERWQRCRARVGPSRWLRNQPTRRRSRGPVPSTSETTTGGADQSGRSSPATNSSMTTRCNRSPEAIGLRPRPACTKSIHNFVSNLGQPAIAVNDVLQGNFSRSWNIASTFCHQHDRRRCGAVRRGDRLGPAQSHSRRFRADARGVGRGPWPERSTAALRPLDVRDSVGKVIDLVSNPTNFIPAGAAATVGANGHRRRGLHRPARRPVEHDRSLWSTTRFDYYAALRSAVRRAARGAGCRRESAGEVAPKDAAPSARRACSCSACRCRPMKRPGSDGPPSPADILKAPR